MCDIYILYNITYIYQYIYQYTLDVEDHFRNVLCNGTIISILTTIIWIWLHDTHGFMDLSC